MWVHIWLSEKLTRNIQSKNWGPHQTEWRVESGADRTPREVVLMVGSIFAKDAIMLFQGQPEDMG